MEISAFLSSKTTGTISTDDLPVLFLNCSQMCDLEMILTGGFNPLNGFLNREDYLSVVKNFRLANGHLWPVPINLAMPKSLIQTVEKKKALLLKDGLSNSLAILHVESIYEPDLSFEAQFVAKTTDTHHPYVQKLLNYEDCVYVGGSLECLSLPKHYDWKGLRHTPEQLKKVFKDNKCNTIIGFQTRNPLHRAHIELIQSFLNDFPSDSRACALLHPAVGETQAKDIPANVRIKCYQHALGYFSSHSVILSLLPLSMRMLGPREALWHSLIRQNYGCTHFIIGRDHAGPSAKNTQGKSFYDPYEAQEFVQRLQSELKIRILCSPEIVYCSEKSKYFFKKDLPEKAKVEFISGSKLRDNLKKNLPIPEWYSYPKIIEELKKYYFIENGFCIYLIGLSGAGKTTIGQALKEKLEEIDSLSRKVSILDGDEIRQNLSPELGFSMKDRSLNVRRMGYLSSKIVQHGGICICANIAPYEQDRIYNREIVEKSGVYIQIFVNTPLRTCEQRDPKGLYKKARQGIIKQFTGIDDPFETPKLNEIELDGQEDVENSVELIIKHLKNKGLIFDT